MKTGKFYFLLLSFSLFVLPFIHAQNNSGFGYYKPDKNVPCMTPAQHNAIEKEIAQSQEHLRSIGILPAYQERSFTTMLEWPLAQNNGLNDFDYHGISNFVDQNLNYPDQVLDYNCGNRTYDLSSGYNHGGTDIYLWPFAWYKMEHDQVKIVAAAPGFIVYKSDGNYDHNCGFNDMDWNAVYVQHADGSIAWYGHMKSGSLTDKSVGEAVFTGDYLGIVGSSGSSTGPHLHFELYDAGDHLIDPWSGNCNSLTNESWWIEQRPYYDSGLNALRTQSAPPEFPLCPDVEITNEKNQFCAGDVVYFAAYYRDQVPEQQLSYKVLRPNHSAFQQWSQTFDVYYSGSYWYWYYTLPAIATTGIWTFQVTYQGEVFEKQFDVNGLTRITDSGTSIICNGQEVTLNAPKSEYGFSYQWKKDGVDIQDATDETLVVHEAGSYNCTVATVNGCTTNSNTIVVTVEDAPPATIVPPGPITLCEGSEITLCANDAFDYFWFNGISQQCTIVDYSGEFTVTVTYENGCTSVASANVTFALNPEVDLGDDIIYLTGTDTVLNAEGPGLTYLWSTGETTPSIVVSEDGIYSVIVTNSDGCSATDEVQVLSSSSTTHPNHLNGITIFPNPVADYIEVSFTNQVHLKPFRVCLYNLQGQLLSSHFIDAPDASQRIDLTSLSPAIYFLYVYSGSEFCVEKLTKGR